MDWSKTVALAEWEHVQSVISRKSDLRLKYRSWLYTLISAVIIASYSNKINITGGVLLCLLLPIVFLFAIKEFIIHVEHRRAIKRSVLIEAAIRNDEINIKDFARLSNHMMKKYTLDDVKQSLKDFRFFVQYLSIILMVIALCLAIS